MSYTALTRKPDSGENPWYSPMVAWMDSVKTALDDIDGNTDTHIADAAVHVPAGGTSGYVLSKASGADGDTTWVAQSAGVTDHGALTGLSDPDHPIAAIIGLQTALDGKSSTSHTHAGYETAGAATAAIAAHVAAGDPHPQYMTSAETAAAYAPLARGIPAGGTASPVQVLAKTSASDYAVGWVNLPSGAPTPPIVYTAPDAATIPLSVKGFASQAANIWQAQLSDNSVAVAVTGIGELRTGVNITNKNGHVRIGIKDDSRVGLLVQGFSATQSAGFASFTDYLGAVKAAISKDGDISGRNIGQPLRVLNAADDVSTFGFIPDTVILRRPA